MVNTRSLLTVSGRQIRVEGRLLRIARLDAEKYHFLDNPEPVLHRLKSCGTRVDLFTFLQPLPDTKPRFSFPMQWDNLAVLPVTTFEHWWTEQIGFKARNKAKQAAKKGVEVREVKFSDALVKGISEVYNECPVRQGRRFLHYAKDLETVHAEESSFLDSSIFIGAFLNGSLIGFIKLVYDESYTHAGLMNIVSMICHRDKAPTNALLAEAVRCCADRGISYLLYSKLHDRNEERSGLSDFKERNGFLRFDLPRYYVPLTRIGQVAFYFGLHKRLAELLPEKVFANLRQVRQFWYNYKLQPQKDIG